MATVEERLFANRLMATPEQARAFDAALQEASSSGTTDRRALLRAFDDATEHHDVMWGLLHLVEAGPHDAYVSALLSESEHLAMLAPEWLERLLVRLLNSPAAAAVLAEQVHAAAADVRFRLRPPLVRISRSNAPGARRATALLSGDR